MLIPTTMNYYRHFINKTHQQFSQEQRVDPISKEKITAGSHVVICAGCKSAFLEDTWRGILEGRHCDQSHTLDTLNGVKGTWVNQAVTPIATHANSVKSTKQIKTTPQTIDPPAPPRHRSNATVKVLALIILVLAGSLGYKQFIYKEKRNVPRVDWAEEDQLKARVREILTASEVSSNGDQVPQRAILTQFYTDEIHLIGPTKDEYLARNKLMNRVFDYLETIAWDNHVIDENSWRIEKEGEDFRVTFRGTYQASFKKQQRVQTIDFQRTYRFNHFQQIYYQRDAYTFK
ncbi:hypothetical protein BKI52_15865 [marine bacterium AO1-C]|nr:hypothetical protein BKI52_15865 [marine bacterium AO1-C]